MNTFEKKEIVKKSVDFDRWYTDVILKAELADYSPVKGCMVIRPYGYAIWENIKQEFDRMIKEAGVENAYFPLFIPYSFLKKEKEHVEGFSPQLAVVTIGGGEKLAEPLVVRPTSETIMYAMYAEWVKSWRDLPLLINQWNNIVRWEKRTYLFLRTTEFLWQEGHTAHESREEARAFTLKALDWYKNLYEKYLAMYPVVGLKSDSEKFAGGDKTYSIELLMPDGLALQGATSHFLGQNFSKVFDISYQDRDGGNDFVWQTSWGLSTRSIGGLIMVHGDDQGLVLPPNIAPIQVIIIPINSDAAIAKFCADLKAGLVREGIRVRVDGREEKTVGWKFNEWELKGVPVRIEVGKKEVESGQLTVARRDINKKSPLPLSDLSYLSNLLSEIQKNLYEKHKKFVTDNTYKVDDYGQFKEIMKAKRGFIYAYWCGDPECERKIKEETKASNRALLLGAEKDKARLPASPRGEPAPPSRGEPARQGKCICCSKVSLNRWYFAQAY